MSSHTHTYHPDTHTHGLADDCERCLEHAKHPFRELDASNIRDLIERTLANRFGGEDSVFGPVQLVRSNAEAVAMASVMNVLERVGRITEVAPDSLWLYLQHRWNVSMASFPESSYSLFGTRVDKSSWTSE